jgi:hypothetical protein
VSAYRSHIENTFHFTCFNPEDSHDPSVGLINGELSIPGNLLRREVFDPVVNQVSCLDFNIGVIKFRMSDVGFGTY